MKPDQPASPNQVNPILNQPGQSESVPDLSTDSFQPTTLPPQKAPQVQPDSPQSVPGPLQTPASFGQLPGNLKGSKQTQPGKRKVLIIALIGALILTVGLILIIFLVLGDDQDSQETSRPESESSDSNYQIYGLDLPVIAFTTEDQWSAADESGKIELLKSDINQIRTVVDFLIDLFEAAQDQSCQQLESDGFFANFRSDNKILTPDPGSEVGLKLDQIFEEFELQFGYLRSDGWDVGSIFKRFGALYIDKSLPGGFSEDDLENLVKQVFQTDNPDPDDQFDLIAEPYLEGLGYFLDDFIPRCRPDLVNDTHRRTVLAAVLAAVEEYRNSHGGQYPDKWADIHDSLEDLIREVGIYDHNKDNNRSFNVSGSWRPGQPATSGDIGNLSTVNPDLSAVGPADLDVAGIGRPADNTLNEDQIFIITEATCDPTGSYIDDFSARRSVAVFYKLEADSDISCVDS